MKIAKSLPIFFSLALMPLPSVNAAHAANMPNTAATPKSAQGQEVQKAPEGMMIVDEQLVYMLPENYPDKSMQSAKKNVGKKDFNAASKDVRKTESYLKAQASRSAQGADTSLVASIAELEKMAALLEAGSAVTDKDLSQAFARAHLALAQNDQQKAQQHMAMKESEKVGEEMKSGANHVAKAAEWSGNKLESGSKKALGATTEVSGKLIKGAGWVPEEVGKGIESLGSEINRLGQKIEKKPAEGSASR